MGDVRGLRLPGSCPCKSMFKVGRFWSLMSMSSRKKNYVSEEMRSGLIINESLPK